MNTHHRSQPADSHGRAPSRFLCRIIRQWIAVFGAQNSRHVASCPACQEYFRASAAMDHAMRRDARQLLRSLPDAPEGFERQIMQAVKTSPLASSRVRSNAWGGKWAIGGLATAAALVIAAVVFNRETRPAGREELVHETPTPADAAVIVEAVESFSNQLVDSVIPSAGNLVAENPLQKELGSVYSDMRSALDFLALNFLPASNTAPVSGTPRTRTI